MSFEDQGTSSPEQTAAVKSKVTVPAVLLIVTGILNLLVAGGVTYVGAKVLMIPPEQLEKAKQEFEKQKRDMKPEERKAVENLDFQKIFEGLGSGGAILGVLGVLASLATIFGAIQMMNLKGYGLAMTGSVLAAIPCISPCCLLGQVAGIWGAVVLLSQDVKSAFR